MSIFGRGGERAFLKRWMKADDLYFANELLRARALYERLAAEAEGLFGADGEQTLLVRACLANTYAEESPEQARILLEEAVSNCERAFGQGDARCLRQRADLANAYGACGDYSACHDLSEALVEQPTPTDWGALLRTCATKTVAATSYRARCVAEARSLGETLTIEWMLDYVRPGRFSVVQKIRGDQLRAPQLDIAGLRETIGIQGREPGNVEVDTYWVTVGSDTCRWPGFGVGGGELRPQREAANRLVVVDSYVALLREATPSRVSVERASEHTAYLIVEYTSVADVWHSVFEVDAPATYLVATGEGQGPGVQEDESLNVQEYTFFDGLTLSGFFKPSPTPSHGDTTLWIDLDRGTLTKAEGRIAAEFADGTEGDLAFKHAFNGYGDDISIADPCQESVLAH